MKNIQRFLASASMIALLGAGCGAAPSSPTGTSPTPTPTPSRPVAGRCLNAYYPLNAGSSISYRSVNSGTEVPFKISVIEHDANGIKLEYDMTVRGRNAKITNELECDGGVVRGRGYFDFASAFLGFDVSYEVLEMSGEILPADMRVGKEWVNTSKVKMTTTDTGPIGSMMNGRISTTKITNKVTAEESVTVPVGTFTALKVEQTIQVQSTISGRPFNTTSNSTAWYVKDVGLVKSVSGSGATAFLLEAEVIED